MAFFDKFRGPPSSGEPVAVREIRRILCEEGVADEAIVGEMCRDIPRTRFYRCSQGCPILLWVGEGSPPPCRTCGRLLGPEQCLEPEEGYMKGEPRDEIAAVAHYRLALACFHRGDLDRAHTALSRAIALKQDFADAYYNRSEVRMAQGDPAGAATDCTEAIRLRPDDADAHLNRGAAKGAQGDFSGCLADTDKAIALGMKKPVARFNRALCLLHLQRVREAMTDLEEFIRQAPDDPRADQAQRLIAMSETKSS